MFPPRRILFPVDFSPRAAATTPIVAKYVRHFHSGVTMLHVLPRACPDEERIQAQEDLGAFGWPHFAGMTACQALTEGDPADRILDYAYDHKVDLIMMPTHGYGPFRRILLGSVAHKVLDGADCPVWTDVHAQAAEPPPDAENSELRVKNVLCAVDLSPASENVLKWASEFAADTGAALSVTHAVPRAMAAAPEFTTLDFTPQIEAAALEQLDLLQKVAGTRATVYVVNGDVAFAIRGAAEAMHADLLVIGRGKGETGAHRLRDQAYAIIRHAPCPVVSV